MRALFVFAAVSAAVFSGGCPGPVEQICGQPTSLPDVDEGFGEATRSDGVDFREEGSWRSQPNSSIDIGTLSILGIVADEQGVVVDDLIADGAFPICVPVGERSDTTAAANLVDEGLVTDAEHDGGVALLGKDGDVLIGRFGFDLVGNDGTVVTFSDGVFRLPQRQ